MGSETEPGKLLLPYLQRADELQKHEPLVAYYCRLYAMEKGLKIPQKERTKTTNSLLISLMNQLEKDKKTVKLGPEDNLYVEGFASNVFTKADKQDRAGRADLNTAKTFYAAGLFFEILNQFGELQPDIEQKQKYAIWKAADIRKALKEGRKPEPGPPGSEKDLSVPSVGPTSTYDMETRDSYPRSPPVGHVPSQHVEKEMGRSESYQANYQSADISSQNFDGTNSQEMGRSESFQAHYPGASISSQNLDSTNSHGSALPPTSPSSHSHTDYPSSDFHQPPPSNRPEVSAYPQPFQHQSYSNDQHPMPLPGYHFQEIPSPPSSFPNFQSYPSFNDSTFPVAPVHPPYNYHSPDAAHSHHSAPSVPNFPSPVQYESGSADRSQTLPSPPPAASYQYDSSYEPPVEKITEAHKAAKFAVGALAFDDVPTAVEFLRKSLELLTNPSAQSH